MNKTPFLLTFAHLLFAFLLLVLTDVVCSSVRLPIITLPLLSFLGLLLLAVGFTFRYLAFKRLLKSNRDWQPKHIPEYFITDNVYRFSRNPAYTGVLLMMTGALLLAINVLMAIALALVFVRFNQLASHEERVLAERFGDAYISYKNKTRKWL